MYMGMTPQQKYWIIHRAKTHIDVADNGCHVWRGVKNQTGYGLIEYRDKLTKKRVSFGVHRIYYALVKELELTREDFVCHKCDNPSCVNIEHLFLGDAKVNNDDKVFKGRYAKKVRYHHREKKYSEAKINEAKELLKSGEKMKEVVRRTGLSQSYVWNINWGKVKKDEGVVYPLMIPQSFKGFSASLDQGRASPYSSA